MTEKQLIKIDKKLRKYLQRKEFLKYDFQEMELIYSNACKKNIIT
jgi:hypothetical protein